MTRFFTGHTSTDWTIRAGVLFLCFMVAGSVYVYRIPDTEDVKFLTEAVYFEARGEPYKGKLAVAHVILNRRESPYFPDSVEEVVKQDMQFSYRNGGDIPPVRNKPLWHSIKVMVYAVLRGKTKDVSQGADHYLNEAFATDGGWTEEMDRTVKIGHHTFYRSR